MNKYTFIAKMTDSLGNSKITYKPCETFIAPLSAFVCQILDNGAAELETKPIIGLVLLDKKYCGSYKNDVGAIVNIEIEVVEHE